MGDIDRDVDSGPDYGPGGYLPDRAARRARKIVLREQMGLVWVIAAAVASVVVAGVGGFYLMLRAAPPQEPFVAVAGIERFDPRGAETATADGAEILVVRAGGGVRVFAAPEVDVAYCAESHRLEGADGSVWDVRGRRTGGDAASLRPLSGTAHDDVLYVNPEEALPAPEPTGADERPVCG